jgi:hypothetical protein
MSGPSSAMGVVRLFPSTQTQIDVFSDNIIESVKNGEASPLETLVLLKALEKASERIMKEIRENVITAAEKYPERTFEFAGASLEKGEVGVKYDYSVCGDPVYEQRQSIMDAAKTLLDERTAFLRALKQPITIVDEGSGEVITIRPPEKKSTTSVKVTIR